MNKKESNNMMKEFNQRNDNNDNDNDNYHSYDNDIIEHHSNELTEKQIADQKDPFVKLSINNV